MNWRRRPDASLGRPSSDAEPIALTPLESLVLERLAREPGQAVSREDIAQLIGGATGNASSNAVTVHLYNLRRKLGRQTIQTIRGRGFRLV